MIPAPKFSCKDRCPSSNLFLGQDDSAQQLILESFHGDSEINDGSAGVDLRGVGRVGKLRGDVQLESFHHINFLVSNFHLDSKNSREIAGFNVASL